MSKATFICSECDLTKDVNFEVGTKPETPHCDKCGMEMKRKFGKIGKGSIIPDDIMYVSRMMSYQSHRN